MSARGSVASLARRCLATTARPVVRGDFSEITAGDLETFTSILGVLLLLSLSGVSIIFKILVFYKA